MGGHRSPTAPCSHAYNTKGAAEGLVHCFGPRSEEGQIELVGWKVEPSDVRTVGGVALDAGVHQIAFCEAGASAK